MKSILFFFLAFLNLSLNAQINVNVNFNDGVFPAGWVNIGNQYQVGTNTNGCGDTSGLFLPNATNQWSWRTNQNVSNGGQITISIKYRVIGTGTGTIDIFPYSEPYINNLATQITTSAPTNGCINLQYIIPAGIVSNGTQFVFGMTTRNFQGVAGRTVSYDDLVITQATLSLDDENLLNKGIKLLPNPVEHRLSIQAQNNIEKVEIYSLSGQLIYQSKNTENYLSDLMSGVYIVKITDEFLNVTTDKLIKK